MSRTKAASGREKRQGDVPFVAAVTVFVLRGDRLLSLRRAPDRDAAPGAWEAVSGRVQAGEQPRDAARRECFEETGLDVAIDPYPITTYTAMRNRDDMMVVAYRGHSESGDVVLSDEHDEAAWMTYEAFALACPFPPLVAAAALAMRAEQDPGAPEPGATPEPAAMPEPDATSEPGATQERGAALEPGAARELEPQGPATAMPPWARLQIDPRPEEVGPQGDRRVGLEHFILWEFVVRPGCQAEFETIYGPDGDWAQLFRRDAGYLGTTLLRDNADPRRYVTIDRWISQGANDAFRERHGEDYDRLDRRCEPLTEKETPLGRYDGASLARAGASQ